VIVRSDGTVTYVGKDIAYQLWKFGLLGKDFGYRYWMEEGVWETTPPRAASRPPGLRRRRRVVNVIDARQSYLQRIVRAGLEASATSRRRALGPLRLRDGGALARRRRASSASSSRGEREQGLEMSGRKGIGVKADDLLDLLEPRAARGDRQRNRELAQDEELDRLAREIATAALRFFMVKATTTRVIAFDLDEALSFEGESGPYLQYSAVRATTSAASPSGAGAEVAPDEAAALPAELWATTSGTWSGTSPGSARWSRRRRTPSSSRWSPATPWSSPAKFNAVYHRHPILQEEDEAVRRARLATVGIFRRGLDELAGVMGIPIPEKM
jgi:arginyl-tRNA synthetase